MTRVLIVEDEPDLADPLAYLLRREAYDVEIAEDGPAALVAQLGLHHDCGDHQGRGVGQEWDPQPETGQEAAHDRTADVADQER